jgi:hypothetical protein
MRSMHCVVAIFLSLSPLLQAESLPPSAQPKVANVALTLELSPPSTLPGIPVTIRIRVTNDSAQRVELPPHIVMLATNDSGETFPLGSQALPQVNGVSLDESFLGPRSSTLLDLEVQGAAIQPYDWLFDSRVNLPGRYRLQAVMGTFSGEFPEVPESAIRTNTATLHVLTPEGLDLAVWKEMLVVGKGSWTPGMIASSMAGQELARRVVTEMPQSTYAGWFATSGPWQPTHESAALLRGWLAQARPDEFTEWREFRLAIFEEAAAGQWSRIPRDEVKAHVRNSRALLAKLMRSKNAKIARLAKERLAESAAFDELAEYGEQRQQQP